MKSRTKLVPMEQIRADLERQQKGFEEHSANLTTSQVMRALEDPADDDDITPIIGAQPKKMPGIASRSWKFWAGLFALFGFLLGVILALRGVVGKEALVGAKAITPRDPTR